MDLGPPTVLEFCSAVCGTAGGCDGGWGLLD